MAPELTKSGKPVSERTFGTLVRKDKVCRHAAVDLDLPESDLSLLGRYMHYNGFRSVDEARNYLQKCLRLNLEPIANLDKKQGKVVSFQDWKNRNSE
jgi:hypothetical protein